MPSLTRSRAGVYTLRFRVGGRGSRFAYHRLGRMGYGDAVKAAAKIVAKEKARRAGDAQTTFSDIAKEYLRVHTPTLSAKGRERAEGVLEKHLEPHFGTLPVEKLTALDVEKYRQARTAAGAAPATVNRELHVFSAVLGRAAAWGLIDRSPLPRGAVTPLAEPTGRLVYFEEAEFRALLAALDDAEALRRAVAPVVEPIGPEDAEGPSRGRRADSDATAAYVAGLQATKPVFLALLLTGSRLGEVIDLRWGAVDFRRRTVTIAQHKVGRPKTQPLSDALEAVLKGLRRGTGDAFVFTRPDGTPFYPMVIQRAFRVARRVAELRPELTVHALRHTHASWLAIAGTPLRTIQELLGHASPTTTAKYAHLSPAHLSEALSVVGGVIGARTVHQKGGLG